MKEKYTPAELEILLFGIYDVITMSAPEYPGDEEEDDNTGGNGIGGGYNPDGWT